MSNRQNPCWYLKHIVHVVFWEEGTICTKTELVKWSKDWPLGLKRNMSFVSWIFFFNIPGLLPKWSMLCIWQVLSFGPGTVYLIRSSVKFKAFVPNNQNRSGPHWIFVTSPRILQVFFLLLVGWFCFCQGDGASLTQEKAGGYPSMKLGQVKLKSHLSKSLQGKRAVPHCSGSQTGTVLLPIGNLIVSGGIWAVTEQVSTVCYQYLMGRGQC